MKFLFKNMNDKTILILKIVTCLLLVLGTIVSPTFLWSFVDILVAILAIINVFAILSLRKDVIIEYMNYKRNEKNDRKRLG